MNKNKRFASVWDAIEDTPADAKNMKLRSALMLAIRDHIKGKDWTQPEAAERLGVTQQLVEAVDAWEHRYLRPRRACQDGNLGRPTGGDPRPRSAVRVAH